MRSEKGCRPECSGGWPAGLPLSLLLHTLPYSQHIHLQTRKMTDGRGPIPLRPLRAPSLQLYGNPAACSGQQARQASAGLGAKPRPPPQSFWREGERNMLWQLVKQGGTFLHKGAEGPLRRKDSEFTACEGDRDKTAFDADRA